MTARRNLAGAAVAALALAPRLSAQVAGTVDVGASWVRYDGFLGSAAAHAATALHFRARDASLAVRGSYLLFESGNTVVQGSFSGSWLPPAVGRLRAEVTASGSMSSYAEFPTYGHFLAGARLHRAGAHAGVWAGGLAGRSYFSNATSNAAELEMGGWFTRRELLVSMAVTRTWFVDTGYVDAVAEMRWRARTIEVAGIAGVRTWSAGGGSGAYAELTAAASIGPRIAVFAGGGRYPSDLVRGVLAGTYFTGGLRVTAFSLFGGAASLERSLADLVRATDRKFSAAAPGTPRLEVVPSSDTLHVLRIAAPNAGRVEVMADFTDWRPVELHRLASGRWEASFAIMPGVHRLNVRLDGGPWLVPDGVRVEADEYGGSVGIILIH